MGHTDQAVFVLELLLALGPLSLYFLTLGLVNSQAHPCVVRSRTDFALLAIALVPVLLAPIAVLAAGGRLWLLAAAAGAIAAALAPVLLRRDESWVIYNTDLEQCGRLLARACHRLGWTLERTPAGFGVESAGLEIHLRAFPWLRNVTVQVRSPGEARVAAGSAAEALMQAVAGEARREAMLPSPAGASLVVIGASLLAVPMWHLFRHMDAIAEAVRQALFA